MVIKSSNADPNVLQDMDNAAADAENALIDMDKEAINAIAGWWKKWYMTAGHTRLGRVLLAQLKKE